MRLNRFVLAAALCVSAPLAAQAPNPPPDLALSPFLSSGLNQPVAVRHAGDGSNRLFVVQKGGTIRVVQLDGSGAPTLLATPFLTQAVTTSSESGLLGLAFHPDYASNGWFYVAFTAPAAEPRLGLTPDQVVARFTVSANDPNIADPASRLDIIRIPDLAGNHNGGDLHFGPDGYLYYSSGDGGPQNDPHGFALCNWKKPANNNINTCSPVVGTNYWLLGKILRLDIDNPTASATADMCGATAGQPANYSIPADNPHVGTTDTCDETWHNGLRNPWRFSFDRETGDMYIADVGQSAREEVNKVALGQSAHFGWGCMEGFRVNKTAAPCVSSATNSFPGSLLPILDYPRSDGGSISGGYAFRGPIGRLQGVYWFGDYNVSSPQVNIWYAYEPAQAGPWPKVALTHHTGVVGFGEDEAGNVYSVSINGNIRKLTSQFIFDDGFQ
ncbi:MAG: PQQ-dependent sugar dehydrogenase [Xanthomonadales bacterium]|nr:PQQ-dependent sugar dehydrogenase [Xanthomonadales bacterium]